jgi:hypothetical protein
MPRVIALFLGLVAGLVGAGVAAGLLIPQLPPDARSPGLVWASASVLIVTGVGVAFVLTRPRRS